MRVDTYLERSPFPVGGGSKNDLGCKATGDLGGIGRGVLEETTQDLDGILLVGVGERCISVMVSDRPIGTSLEEELDHGEGGLLGCNV